MIDPFTAFAALKAASSSISTAIKVGKDVEKITSLHLFFSLKSVFDTNLNQTGHTHQNATRTVNHICFVEQILPCYKC